MGCAGIFEKKKRYEEVMPKSKVFVLLLMSFWGGVFLYSFLKTPLIIIGGVFVFGVFVLLRSVYRRIDKAEFILGIIFGICILVFGFGLWRSAAFFEDAGRGNISGLDDKTVEFSGLISEEPDIRMDVAYYVLETPDFGKVLVKAALWPARSYGDSLTVKGVIRRPENFDGFDYKNYLAKREIFWVSQNSKIIKANSSGRKTFFGSLFSYKNAFIANVNKILNEPHASFLNALLLGAGRGLPKDLIEAFNKTGTSHVVAISGYNISLISVIIFNFLAYLLVPKRVSVWIVGAGIVFFTIISGAGASVVRAAIMGGLLIIARARDRIYGVGNALVFAGALMLFLNPRLLRYDAGFQLSFLATMGLIYLSPYFDKWFVRIPNFLSLRSNLTATLSAQTATLPVLLFGFGQFSLVAPLANILILPAIPPTMLFGFLAGIVSFVSIGLASIIAIPAWALLSWQLFVVKFLSALL